MSIGAASAVIGINGVAVISAPLLLQSNIIISISASSESDNVNHQTISMRRAGKKLRRASRPSLAMKGSSMSGQYQCALRGAAGASTRKKTMRLCGEVVGGGACGAVAKQYRRIETWRRRPARAMKCERGTWPGASTGMRIHRQEMCAYITHKQ